MCTLVSPQAFNFWITCYVQDTQKKKKLSNRQKPKSKSSIIFEGKITSFGSSPENLSIVRLCGGEKAAYLLCTTALKATFERSKMAEGTLTSFQDQTGLTTKL